MTFGRKSPNDWVTEYDPTSEMDDVWYRKENTSDETPATHSSELPVFVEVNNFGHVASVTLAEEWKRSLDPRELPSFILEALHAETMKVATEQVGQLDTTCTEVAKAPTEVPDNSPLSRGDVHRLLDEVQADLSEFTKQLDLQTSHPVSITSAGGHVQGSADRGRVSELNIDPSWASSSRRSEIELELNEVLSQLTEKSAPKEIMEGPRSRAIDELNSLVSDPQSFIRRIGLPPQEQ